MKINEAKKVLGEELTQIQKDLATLGVQNPNTKEDWVATPADPVKNEPDPNVQADRNEDWIDRRGILDTLETRFNNINRALEKIASDTFGTCEICNEPIENDRLEANLAARTCKAHINNEVQILN